MKCSHLQRGNKFLTHIKCTTFETFETLPIHALIDRRWSREAKNSWKAQWSSRMRPPPAAVPRDPSRQQTGSYGSLWLRVETHRNPGSLENPWNSRWMKVNSPQNMVIRGADYPHTAYFCCHDSERILYNDYQRQTGGKTETPKGCPIPPIPVKHMQMPFCDQALEPRRQHRSLYPWPGNCWVKETTYF